MNLIGQLMIGPMLTNGTTLVGSHRNLRISWCLEMSSKYGKEENEQEPYERQRHVHRSETSIMISLVNQKN